ncbi:20541_t:CDS:2 [Rhizophagus irregularis]|nr:20541_t:CDS:2 [Rhizophagus irregularis]
MSLNLFPRLSENLCSLLEYAEDYDVIIRVGGGSNNNSSNSVTPGTSPTEVSPILSSNDLILSLHNITKKSASYSNSLTVSPPVSPSVTPFSPPVRTIDSTIITHQQAALIACWIDRKNVKDFTPLTSIPYIFRLLFRGSRDGFSAKTFHDKCDGRGATIVVVRVSGTKELIGGYNPIGWSSPRDVEWRGTRDSFIFSLSNSHSDSSNNVSTPKSKISRIKKDCVNEAIQLQDKLGPSFGFYELKIIDDAHEGSSSYASGNLIEKFSAK